MAIYFIPAGEIDGEGDAQVLSNPTSLDFGLDGRLYVVEQNGTINAFTVSVENGEYDATVHEELLLPNGLGVVKGIQNHNDDGSENGSTDRQVTGIVADKNAAIPTLYISSSDNRIATNNDSNLDTNSGVVTRVTWNPVAGETGEWEAVDIVRGLPRSEETPLRQRPAAEPGRHQAVPRDRRQHEHRRRRRLLRPHQRVHPVRNGHRDRPHGLGAGRSWLDEAGIDHVTVEIDRPATRHARRVLGIGGTCFNSGVRRIDFRHPYAADPRCLVLSYERHILDKRGLIRAIAGHSGLPVRDPQVEVFAARIDVVPETEDARRFVRRVLPGDHRDKPRPETIARLDQICAPVAGLFAG